jgi:H+/Cl- antiporter ClcA
VELSTKALPIYFSVIFVSGLLIRVFVSPILWPNIPEITDPGNILLSAAVVFLCLGAVYYLKTQGSPTQNRIAFDIAAALAFALTFVLIVFVIFTTMLGSSGGDLFTPMFFPLYLLGLIIGGAVGNWLAKRTEIRTSL